MVPKPRRTILETRKMPVGLERSQTRSDLLDAAERIMFDEGYAAVSTRRLGAVADVKPQLVHYYFPSLDDLFAAVYRRQAERYLAAVRAALEADDPLGELWRIARHPTRAGLGAEFTALSRHRKGLRAEIRAFSEELRALQLTALRERFTDGGSASDADLKAMILLMAGLGMVLVLEDEIGMTVGHAEAEALVGRAIAEVQGAPVR